MAEQTVVKSGRVLKDITGQRFGMLVVTGRDRRDGEREAHWHVRCDCGGATIVRGGSLRSGLQDSCGCAGLERTKKAATKHGRTNDSIFHIWSGMRFRTRNPNSKSWKRYGGRGITMCDRWFDSFEAFLADMGERPSSRHSVERMKNDLGYEPGNCRWALPKEQSRNKSDNHIVVYRGRSMPLAEACETAAAGVPWHKARNRIDKLGWNVERAVESAEDGRKNRG